MTNIISRYRQAIKKMKADKVIANSFAAVERVHTNLQDVVLSICSEVGNIDKKELDGTSKTFAYFIAAIITIPIAIILIAYHVITFWSEYKPDEAPIFHGFAQEPPVFNPAASAQIILDEEI